MHKSAHAVACPFTQGFIVGVNMPRGHLSFCHSSIKVAAVICTRCNRHSKTQSNTEGLQILLCTESNTARQHAPNRLWLLGATVDTMRSAKRIAKDTTLYKARHQA
jgi:hypothetical protein